MNSHNTFEEPNAVATGVFSKFESDGETLNVTMPPKSVIVLEIEGLREIPPAIELKNPKKGINYCYFEGLWERIPSFNSLTPKKRGFIYNFDFPEEIAEENFGIGYEGYIKITTPGLYTFYVTSDDGSSLSIDGRLVVDNDGQHAAAEQSGVCELTSGYHRIGVSFFQAGGGKTLKVDFEGPGITREAVPSDILFRN
jgi:PA14 domain